MDVSPPTDQPAQTREVVVSSGRADREGEVVVVVSAAFSVIFLGILIALALRARHFRRPPWAEPMIACTCAEVASVAIFFATVTAPSLHGSPAPSNAREVSCTVSSGSIQCYSDSILQNDKLVLLVAEPVRVRISLDGHAKATDHECLVSIEQYGVHTVTATHGGEAELWFKPTGAEPARMSVDGPECPASRRVEIDVAERESYFRWASTRLAASDYQRTYPPSLKGQKKYENLCFECHSVDGSDGPHGGPSGPSFKGLYGSTVRLTNGVERQVDEEFLRWAILRRKPPRWALWSSPSGGTSDGEVCDARYACTMPDFTGQLTLENAESLIAFIKLQR